MDYFSRLLILSCFTLSCTIMSCDKEDSTSEEPQCGKAVLPHDADQYSNLITDSISVVGVRLESTCLMVDFSYSGCERRETDVMVYLDQSPFIPILNAKINNVDPMDACLGFFMHTDTFDLATSSFDLYDGMLLSVEDWSDSFTIDLDE